MTTLTTVNPNNNDDVEQLSIEDEYFALIKDFIPRGDIGVRDSEVGKHVMDNSKTVHLKERTTRKRCLEYWIQKGLLQRKESTVHPNSFYVIWHKDQTNNNNNNNSIKPPSPAADYKNNSNENDIATVDAASLQQSLVIKSEKEARNIFAEYNSVGLDSFSSNLNKILGDDNNYLNSEPSQHSRHFVFKQGCLELNSALESLLQESRKVPTRSEQVLRLFELCVGDNAQVAVECCFQYEENISALVTILCKTHPFYANTELRDVSADNPEPAATTARRVFCRALTIWNTISPLLPEQLCKTWSERVRTSLKLPSSSIPSSTTNYVGNPWDCVFDDDFIQNRRSLSKNRTVLNNNDWRDLSIISNHRGVLVEEKQFQNDGNKYVLKSYAKNNNNANAEIKREIQVYKLTSGHPHIVEAVGLVYDNHQSTSPQGLLLRKEKTDILRWFKTKSRNDPAPHIGNRLRILAQTASALCFFHTIDVIHNDFNPSQILVSHSNPGFPSDLGSANAKLCDFGLSQDIASVRGRNVQLGRYGHTPGYVSQMKLNFDKNVRPSRAHYEQWEVITFGRVMWVMMNTATTVENILANDDTIRNGNAKNNDENDNNNTNHCGPTRCQLSNGDKEALGVESSQKLTELIEDACLDNEENQMTMRKIFDELNKLITVEA